MNARQLLNVVLKANVSHAARLLWLLLYTDEQVTWRSTMAKTLGLSSRQTDRCLTELEEAGLVVSVNRWQAGLEGTGKVWTAQLPTDGAAKKTTAQQVDLEDLIVTNPPTKEDVWAAKKLGGQ